MYWFLSVDTNSFAEGTGFVPEGNDFFMESAVFPGSVLVSLQSFGFFVERTGLEFF